MSDNTGTGAGLIAFLEYIGEKGLVNAGTAKAYRAAVREIFGAIEEDWESIDVRQVDADDLVRRFEIKAGMRYTPKSLSTYKSRLRLALQMYTQYLQDPGGWRPARPQGRSQGGGAARSRRVAATTATGRGSAVDAPVTVVGEPGTVQEHSYAQPIDMHSYTYPIRREGRTVFATLSLPVDLTMKEAVRIGDYLKTLAVEETPPIHGQPALPRPSHPDAG